MPKRKRGQQEIQEISECDEWCVEAMHDRVVVYVCKADEIESESEDEVVYDEGFESESYEDEDDDELNENEVSELIRAFKAMKASEAVEDEPKPKKMKTK